MKQFITLPAFLLASIFTYSQANTKLSNLVAPTAVSQSLLPNATNARDLGSSSYSWRNLYLRGYVYLDGIRFLSNAPGTAQHNTFVGSYTANSLSSGVSNAALGHAALYRTTTGYSNAALGAYALYNNTSGYSNIAVGTRALYLNSNGYWNVAVGDSALYNNTSYVNSAFGYKALFSNSSGSSNTAIGTEALFANTTGANNTAVGAYALVNNTTGSGNFAYGYTALVNNTVGNNNKAFGASSLYQNTTGSFNLAFGDGSMMFNNGSYNTAVGDYSLQSTYNSQYNTAVGYTAGNGYNNGWNNVFVGANTTTNGAGYYNVICIGQATIVAASNQARFGNPATIYYNGYAPWTVISDGRYKKNVKEDVPGLSFIIQLRPVTYNLDASGLNEFINKGRAKQTQPNEKAKELMDKALKEKEAIVQTGFVAQEVEQAAKRAGYNFSGVYKPVNDKDVYGLSYADFVVPLVKAVQELDSANKAKDERIITLESQMAELRQMVLELKGSTGTVTSNKAYLEQNTPNPVTGSTIIRYHLPENTSSAVLNVTTAEGKLMRTLRLNSHSGQVTLNTSTIASGTYNYTLVVDGKQADAKRLVIVR